MASGPSGDFEVEGFFALLVAANSEICDIFRIRECVVAETDPFDYVNKSTNFNFRDHHHSNQGGYFPRTGEPSNKRSATQTDTPFQPTFQPEDSTRQLLTLTIGRAGAARISLPQMVA